MHTSAFCSFVSRSIDLMHVHISYSFRFGVAASNWLARNFARAVTEPVRLHVAAKRYLCFSEPTYAEKLSSASRSSLEIQVSELNMTVTFLGWDIHPLVDTACCNSSVILKTAIVENTVY